METLENPASQPQPSVPAIRPESANQQLSEAKRMLMEHWKKGGATEIGIPLRSQPGPALLSFAQQRFWFLEQLMPGNAAYNLLTGIQLCGSLDIVALERALNAIIERHEILHTAFLERAGVPLQHVRPAFMLTLIPIVLSTLSEQERQQRVREEARCESEQAFDLKAGQLLRAKLLDMGEHEYILLLTFHHIIFDGWSNVLLLKELSLLYGVFTERIHLSGDLATLLPKLPIQYADFAHWQQQQMQSEKIARQITYWQQHLAGITRYELPTDYPRPALPAMQGAQGSRHLSQRLTDDIKAFSRKEGITPSTTLLAAFQLLLARYTGQTDIALGTPAAYRERIETEPLLGLFLNTLILRTDLSGDPTFQELVQRVRMVTTDAYSNQDLPYEKLLEVLQLERELSRNPLFDVLFNAISIPDAEQCFDGADMRWKFLEFSDIMAKFSLTMYVYENEGRLKLLAVYQKSLFTHQRIVVLLDQLDYLLQQIVSAPQLHLSAYTLVTAQTRELLPTLSQTLASPEFQPCTEDILSWAKRTPLHVAVRQNEQAWTYAQLVGDSQRCAEELCTAGLQKGDVVALSGSSSYGLIVGIVGIFLSGGVLLTLDRKIPIIRRLAMLEQAHARFLLSLSDFSAVDADLEPFPFIQRSCLDAKTGQILQSRSSRGSVSLPFLSGEEPAYIFFTSGTTGTPKGVLGVHKGLSHFLHWQRNAFVVESKDRHAQLTGLAFDVVLRDILLPLTSGATLCLPQEEWGNLSPEVLSWLVREEITVLHAVPSLAHAWLAASAITPSIPSLRLTFFAGEPLTETLVNAWRMILSEHGQIINLYGPTETTLARCFYVIPFQLSTGIQPVGQAIPQSQALVLTPQRSLCGVYEPGEVAIRTPFRTRGYLDQETNAGRFILNPFNEEDADDLLYLTGDRGVYRYDGLLELRGRLDHQVKIHGIRIEPEEIAAVLEQYRAVQAASVLVQNQGAHEKYLVAYLVLHADVSCDPEDLKTWLRIQLPEYMIPSEFVLLERFPLTPNGKVDRVALLQQKGVRLTPEGHQTPPASKLEQLVFQIWLELLPLKQFGVTDNFFDIGGHSLLVIQVQSKLQVALHLRKQELYGDTHSEHVESTVSVIDLFRYPTIRKLARYLESNASGAETLDRHDDQWESGEKRKDVRRQYSWRRTERRR